MVISVLEKMILLRFRSIATYMWCRIWFSEIGLLSFCANLEILVLSNRAVVEGCLNSDYQGRSNASSRFIWSERARSICGLFGFEPRSSFLGVPGVEAGGGVNNDGFLFSEEDECLPRSC
ncbi:hypothetical protein U1Q18_040349 [Sarracenia purpurea var. burkii]